MAQEIINVGTAANDGQGDPIRSAFTKTNNNFSQLFAAGGVSGISNGTSNINILNSGAILMSPQGTANVVSVTSIGATVTGTLVGNPNISATGNVIAGNFFVGNGRQLTGVLSTADAALITGNTLSANVITSSLTTVGTLGSLSVTANVRSGNLTTPGAVSATGNVTGGNISAGTAISAGGNITGGNIITAGAVSVGGIISAAGNVNIGTQYFIGNGSQLSGIAVSSNAALLTFSTLSSNVTLSSLTQVGNLSSLVVSNALGTGTITANGSITTGNILSAAGNVTGANINSAGIVSAVGNITTSAGNIRGLNLSVTANVISGNIDVATEIKSGGVATVTGNITGGNLLTPGAITATGNAVVANVFTGGTANVNSLLVVTTAQVTGNITGGNLITSGLANITGRVEAGNVLTYGTITANGNVTAPNFIGNIAGNISGNISAAGSNTQVLFNDAGVTNATSSMVFVKTTGALTVSGTATAGNVSTTGNVTVGGNISVGGTNSYFNSPNFYAVDPIVSFGRNANNQPLLSQDNKDRGTQLYYFATAEKSSFIGYQALTGNLIAAAAVTVTNEVVTVNSYGNFVVGDLLGSSVSVTGNITGGNILGGANVNATTHTGATVSVSGNVTGGNLNAAGLSLSSNVVSAVNLSSSLTAATTISAIGNVGGGNIISAALLQGTTLSVTGNTATVTTANYQIGYRDLPQVSLSGAPTLTITDGGKHYYGSGTITIPSNANVAFTVGTAILVVSTGGASTITTQAGVSLIQSGTGNTGTRTLASDGMATLLKVATNTWYINGSGVT